jgi:hypothetical protein
MHPAPGICVPGFSGSIHWRRESMASIWQDSNIIVDNAGQVANAITAS